MHSKMGPVRQNPTDKWQHHLIAYILVMHLFQGKLQCITISQQHIYKKTYKLKPVS